MRLMFDTDRATGVAYRHGGRSCTVNARREVILCGGVINSPHLLQVSGIGEAGHLAGIGVAMKAALPGVGHNLSDHYTPRFKARVANAITFNERVRGLAFWAEAAKGAAGRPLAQSFP